MNLKQTFDQAIADQRWWDAADVLYQWAKKWRLKSGTVLNRIRDWDHVFDPAWFESEEFEMFKAKCIRDLPADRPMVSPQDAEKALKEIAELDKNL